MKGAYEYAGLFKTGQYGRLYIVSGYHARGKTFHIYLLPEGEEAKRNGPHNPPLNKGAVEIYGITGGLPGWTETYGWLHNGPWVKDFEALATSFRMEKEAEEARNQALCEEQEKARKEREKAILDTYSGIGYTREVK